MSRRPPFDAIHDPGCNCWPHVSQRAAQERINALTHALRETLSLAFVANEGDPWFATEAGIEAEAVLARAREVLEAPVEGEPPPSVPHADWLRTHLSEHEFAYRLDATLDELRLAGLLD